MFSDSSSTTSSSANDAPAFISIPMVDSSSDSHSEKNLPHPSTHPSTCGLPRNDPGEIFQGYRGQLKLSICIRGDLLTVHVISGRNIHSVRKNPCDSYVKVSLVPDDTKKTRCKTEVVQASSSPCFDEKFSFEMIEEDITKRVFISLWHRDNIRQGCEFLGCMSFSIWNIYEHKKVVHGWYYLLIGDVGQRRHLRVKENKAIHRENTHLQTISVSVRRGHNGGFGFSISGSGMVQICRVDHISYAAGLRVNDIILRIDGQNVRGLSTDAVAKIIRNVPNSVILDVQRLEVFQIETMDHSPTFIRRGSRRWKSANVPECRLRNGSASVVTTVNYGWLDGVDDVRCSSSSCGSNSSSREALAPANTTLVEGATGMQQVLETVDEDVTLEIEDDAEDRGKEEINREEEEEEEEENLEDYMDSFKYDSLDSDEQQVNIQKPQKFPAVEHPDANKENDVCSNVANPHWCNSLRSTGEDSTMTAFSSLPRSLSKPRAEIQDYYDCPSKLPNADGQEFRFHDFSSSLAKLTVPQKSQGVFKRSASLRCAIFPKLSKLKTVFKPKN